MALVFFDDIACLMLKPSTDFKSNSIPKVSILLKIVTF